MEKIKTLVIASGYFNPVHRGHIDYLTQSKELGDKLFVIVNNDAQREMKGSKEFMNEDERKHTEHAQRLPLGPATSWGNQRRISREELYKILTELVKDIFNNIYIYTYDKL